MAFASAGTLRRNSSVRAMTDPVISCPSLNLGIFGRIRSVIAGFGVVDEGVDVGVDTVCNDSVRLSGSTPSLTILQKPYPALVFPPMPYFSRATCNQPFANSTSFESTSLLRRRGARAYTKVVPATVKKVTGLGFWSLVGSFFSP